MVCDPYVSGGLGILHVSHNEPTVPARANLSAYNVGGGAVGFLTNKVGLRFDLRYFRTLPPGEESGEQTVTEFLDRVHVHYWTVTVGVVFRVLTEGSDLVFCTGVLFRRHTRSRRAKNRCDPLARARLGRDLQPGFPIAGGIDAAVQDGSLDDDHRRS